MAQANPGYQGPRTQQGSSVGDHREPVIVAILGVVTFGIYFWYWLWTSSKSAERFDPRASSPFSVAKWAIPTGAIGTVAMWGAIIAMFATLGSLPSNPDPDTVGGAMAGFGILMLLGLLLALVGGIGILVAEWRLWKFSEHHERGIGVRDPISPGLMLGLVLAPAILSLVPLVNLLMIIAGPIAAGYVLYRTQQALNRVWDAAGQGYEPQDAFQGGPRGQPPAQGAGTTGYQDPSAGAQQPGGSQPPGRSQDPQGPTGQPGPAGDEAERDTGSGSDEPRE